MRQNKPLQFHNPQFEAACAEAVGRPVGRIRARDLRGIEVLSIYEGKLYLDERENPDAAYAARRAFFEEKKQYPAVDLTDLQLFPDLHMLNLQFVEPENMCVLKKLGLTYLGLYGIRLDSWDEVNQLKNLQSINISATTATKGKLDFSNFTNLKMLSLNMLLGNQWAEEFTGLETLKNLQLLKGICMFKTIDLSFLSGMTALEWCDFILPKGTDVSAVAECKNLHSLCLMGVAHDTDLERLQQLPALEVLGVCETKEAGAKGIYQIKGKGCRYEDVQKKHFEVFDLIIRAFQENNK